MDRAIPAESTTAQLRDINPELRDPAAVVVANAAEQGRASGETQPVPWSVTLAGAALAALAVWLLLIALG